MTVESSPQKKSSVLGKISGLKFFRNQNIGRKLTLGFGILVVLVFLVLLFWTLIRMVFWILRHQPMVVQFLMMRFH